MRFAWEREKSGNTATLEQGFVSRLIYIAYNVIYFIIILLPIFGIIEYSTGFMAFFVFILIRAAANMYRNNVLELEQAEVFPLRSP